MSKKKEIIQLSDHFTYEKLIRFVIPSIIMMLFTSIYGVVDGLFVSNYVGKIPFAAINLVMPVLMLFGGIGFMLGTGGTALVSKTLGEDKKELANEYFSMIIIVTFLIGATISILGIIFMRPICILLGADEELLPNCMVYGRILIGFCVAFMMQNVFQSFFIAAEKPQLGLKITVISGVTNMILDALFIAIFKWGIIGAGFATGISQAVGALLPLWFFCRPNSTIFRLKRTRLKARPVLKAMANGSSEMVNNITGSIVGMLYNFQLLKYAGDDGVAAYGVLMYVGFVFIAIFIGYSIGVAPITGFNFGAKNEDELKNIFKKSVILMFTIGFVLFLSAELLASPLAKLFVGYDKNLYDMTVSCFRITVTTYIVTGYNIFASSFFTALNNGLISAEISFMRTFIFKLAAVLILPVLFGLGGIWWAEVTAEIAAFVLSSLFLITQNKKYHYM